MARTGTPPREKARVYRAVLHQCRAAGGYLGPLPY